MAWDSAGSGSPWLSFLFLDGVAMTATAGLANPHPASPLQTQLLHILCSLGNQNMLLFLVFSLLMSVSPFVWNQ